MVDRMMEEYDDNDDVAEAVVDSFVLYCMSLCAVMALYCVLFYTFYLAYFCSLPPPPPPPPPSF